MQTLILILSIKYFSSNFLSLVFYQTLTWYQMKTTFHHYLLFTVSFMVSFASLTLYFLYISFLLIIIISNEKKNSQVLGLLKFSTSQGSRTNLSRFLNQPFKVLELITLGSRTNLSSILNESL